MASETSQTETESGAEIWGRWRPRLVPAAIAVAALVLCGGLLSFRGLDSATIEALTGGDGWKSLTRPHPLY
ncbi:MAG: hypothetical protein ABEN55_22910, partial [Bradymonadaceae bacterium]